MMFGDMERTLFILAHLGHEFLITTYIIRTVKSLHAVISPYAMSDKDERSYCCKYMHFKTQITHIIHFQIYMFEIEQ